MTHKQNPSASPECAVTDVMTHLPLVHLYKERLHKQKTQRRADKYSSLNRRVYLIKRVSYSICEGSSGVCLRERRMCMSLYVRKGRRQIGRGGEEGGRGCTHSQWFGRSRAIYHLSAAWMYKLFGLLEIYILYNYFGSIVSVGSHNSQVNALN